MYVWSVLALLVKHGLIDRMDSCIPSYVGLQSILVNMANYVCLLRSSSTYWYSQCMLHGDLSRCL